MYTGFKCGKTHMHVHTVGEAPGKQCAVEVFVLLPRKWSRHKWSEWTVYNNINGHLVFRVNL